MKVHLVGPDSPVLLATANVFQHRGDCVTHSDQAAPEADVYIFYVGHDAMKRLARGVVILDLRGDAAIDAAAWLPYADLGLVRQPSDRLALVEACGCEPERIFVAPDVETIVLLVEQARQNSVPAIGAEKMTDDIAAIIEICDPAIDGQAIARQVSQQVARRWATNANVPDPAALGPESLRPGRLACAADTSPADGASWFKALAELEAQRYLREPGFVSHAPLIGPLVVGVRRLWNWMSTKWYVRPIVQQQSEVNARIAQFIHDLVQRRELDALRLGQLEAQLAALETRLARLEAKNKP